jgi:hypothetical protein
MIAWAYKYGVHQPYMYPRNDLDYESNFLQMMFAVPAEDYEVDPVVVKALEVLLILHADHGQNCSSSAVRLVGSGEANIFSSVAAGDPCPERSAARWRQPGRAGDAERIVESGDTSTRSSHGQGQERSLPSDGLRAPGLQELRSPGQDHQEGRRRRPRPART